MDALLAFIVLAQEESADLAEEGKNVITVMLLVGLTFVTVILLGQLTRHVAHRRRERREARRRLY